MGTANDSGYAASADRSNADGVPGAASVDLQQVRALVVSYHDNASISRAKVLPARALDAAASHGITISNSVGFLFSVDDHLNETAALDPIVGDLRGIPDLSATAMLDPATGLAWAPADLHALDGSLHPTCTRSALRRVVADATSAGFEFRVGFELEFTLFRDAVAGAGGTAGPGTAVEPLLAAGGPGYSTRAVLDVEAFMLDTLSALDVAGVPVAQFHPEFGDGQYELAFAPRDPLRAVDDLALARIVILRTAAAQGLRVSFAPVPLVGSATNGCHVHLSATHDGTALLADPDATLGFTSTGGQLIAGILDRLEEGVALLGGSVLSFVRLSPHSWAGADICWGAANREAAIRFVSGQVADAALQARQANIEVKPVDAAANPYLAVAAILASAVDGVQRRVKLPDPVEIDPSRLSDEERAHRGIRRLPADLATALDLLDGSEFFRGVFGDVLLDAYLAVRRHEAETFGRRPPQNVADAVRWRY